jgi:hypothetical protein
VKEKSIIITSAVALLIGCILGMVGSFLPSDAFRSPAWAVGSASLILASALLTVFYFRKGLDMVAVGFLIYAIAESVVFSSCATNLDNTSSFGAGVFLWALAIAILSLQNIFPLFVRGTGIIAATLFAIVAVRIFTGDSLNALAKPFPFFAYPFFAATLIGWAWTLLKREQRIENRE